MINQVKFSTSTENKFSVICSEDRNNEIRLQFADVSIRYRGLSKFSEG